MSLKAMAWAFDQETKPVSKLVLLTLSDYCDDDGRCLQPVATVANRTGLCEKATRTAIRDLEEMEFVETIARFDRTGRQVANEYRVLFVGRRNDVPPALPESDPRPVAGSAPGEDVPKMESSSSPKKKNKKGSKNPPTPHGAESFDLPFSSVRFRESFECWLRHRAEKRSRLRPDSQAWSQQRKRMVGWGEANSIAAIEHSVGNDWHALALPFELKRQNGGAGWAGGEQQWTEDEKRRMGELPDGGDVAH